MEYRKYFHGSTSWARSTSAEVLLGGQKYFRRSTCSPQARGYGGRRASAGRRPRRGLGVATGPPRSVRPRSGLGAAAGLPRSRGGPPRSALRTDRYPLPIPPYTSRIGIAYESHRTRTGIVYVRMGHVQDSYTNRIETVHPSCASVYDLYRIL